MFRAFLFTIISLSLLIVGCSSPEEQANELYVNAMLVLKEAKHAESTSYSEAFRLYSSVITIFDTIVSKYPSTSLAVKIVRNDERIGQYTYDDYKNIFLKQLKVKADAEDSPLFCSLLVAKSIPLDYMKNDALLKIANTYADNGNMTMANDILDNYISFAYLAPNSKSFKDWASSLLHCDIIDVISDIINMSRIYNISGNTHKAIKGIETANELFKYINNAQDKIQALNEIASYYKIFPDNNKTLSIASQAIDIYNNLNNNSCALSQIANIYLLANDNYNALRIASQAYSIALSDNDYTYFPLIAVVFASAGDTTNAIEVVKAIPSDDIGKDVAVNDIAIIFAKQGFIDKSIDLANSISSKYLKQSTILSIGDKCAEINKQLMALDLASQALELSKGINSFPNDASKLARVAALYIKAGDKEKALYALSLALDKVKHAATEYTDYKSSRTHCNAEVDAQRLGALAESLIDIGKDQSISGILLESNVKHVLHAALDTINN